MRENPIKSCEKNWWEATNLVLKALETLQNNVDGSYFDMKKDRINDLRELYQQMRSDYNWVVFGHK